MSAALGQTIIMEKQDASRSLPEAVIYARLSALPRVTGGRMTSVHAVNWATDRKQIVIADVMFFKPVSFKIGQCVSNDSSYFKPER